MGSTDGKSENVETAHNNPEAEKKGTEVNVQEKVSISSFFRSMLHFESLLIITCPVSPPSRIICPSVLESRTAKVRTLKSLVTDENSRAATLMIALPTPTRAREKHPYLGTKNPRRISLSSTYLTHREPVPTAMLLIYQGMLFLHLSLS